MTISSALVSARLTQQMTAFEIISLLSSYLLFKFSLKLLVIILPLEHIHKRWALLMKGRILVNESTLLHLQKNTQVRNKQSFVGRLPPPPPQPCPCTTKMRHLSREVSR